MYNKFYRAHILLILFIGFLLVKSTQAQVITVTATITDSDGQTWNNGTWAVQIYSPNQTPYYNGTSIPQVIQSGSLSASGALSVSLYNTVTITPSTAQYTWTLCPNAKVSCSVFTTPVTTTNMSAILSAQVIAPRFYAGLGAYGYSDTEVIGTPGIGLGYFNVTTLVNRIWNGSAFINSGGSTGGGTPTGPAGGNLGGTYPNPTLAIIPSVTAGSYGAANQIPNVTVNSMGLVTGVATSAISIASPIMNGLVLWNKNDEATGIAPVDYSGNNNTSTLPASSTNYPTGTPLGHLFSASTPQWYSLPSAVSSVGQTYMATLCTYQPTASINWYQPTFISSTVSGGLLLSLQGYASIFGTQSGVWTPSLGLMSDYTSGYLPRTTSNIGLGDCHVYTWIIANPDRILVDGTEVAYQAHGTSTAGIGQGTMQVGGGVVLGNLGTGTSNGANFYGLLRNLFVYNRVLSANELTQMSNTAQQLAIQAGAQFTYAPAADAANRLIATGDSITCKTGSTVGYWEAGFTPTETVSKFATCLPGRMMTAVAATAISEIAPLLASGAAHNTVVIFAGTNEVHGTAAQILAEYGKATNALHGLKPPPKVIWAPMLSRGGGYDNWKNTINPVLLASWPQIADGYVNWSNDPLLGADGAYSSSTYFNSDLVHPTTTGQTLMGGYLTNTYNKLYGSTDTNPVILTTTAAHTLLASETFVIDKASNALTLPSCLGYVGFWQVKVGPGVIVTMANATAAQTIDGIDYSTTPLSLTAGTKYRFQVIPGTSAAAGCTWSLN